jgi:phage terminase small subunit
MHQIPADNGSEITMANRTNSLTPKQLHFCRAVVSGQTLSDSYREAYSAGNMSAASIHTEASMLMSNPMITQRVERLQRQKDRAVVVSSITDRERVLDKLRATLDTHEGGPVVTAQLRAAELLGRTMGLFKDVQQVQEKPRTAAEVAAELEERLAALEEKPDPAMH